MNQYTAPTKDMLFAIEHLANIDTVNQIPSFADATMDTVQAILEESAKLTQEVIGPLNVTGDRHPSSWNSDFSVTTTPGFKDAFQQFVEGGWQGLVHPTEFGGQNLPKLLATACAEMLHASNLSFALCPLLTDGAIEALLTAGSPELKNLFIPKLISGKWTGTMNLTEPQAGSDLALIRSRAERQTDGTYKIFGTKIFITYGEHDYCENICHLVLARTPDAPEGIKGISLFMVPKYDVHPDGSLGDRNDVYCVSIEHKLGIKASPTAVLQYGDNGGAKGYIIGEENRGLEYMFVMMNAARFGVGIQGLAISERAYQQAVNYAKDRLQSRDLTGSSGAVAIIQHPDIKRMLMTMRATIEAGRAMSYVGAMHYDLAHHHPDPAIRSHNQAIYEFLVPLIKGYLTEQSVELCSLGVQIHGGMGFIEETGAAQHYRDARILPIYEGTTAIQANDLVGRKTVRDGGKVVQLLCDEMAKVEQQLAAMDHPQAAIILKHLKNARTTLTNIVDFIIKNVKTDIKNVFAGSVPYLKLTAITVCGWQMARAFIKAHALHNSDPQFYAAKMVTATFYATHIVSQVPAIGTAILEGGESANALSAEAF